MIDKASTQPFEWYVESLRLLRASGNRNEYEWAFNTIYGLAEYPRGLTEQERLEEIKKIGRAMFELDWENEPTYYRDENGVNRKSYPNQICGSPM